MVNNNMLGNNDLIQNHTNKETNLLIQNTESIMNKQQQMASMEITHSIIGFREVLHWGRLWSCHHTKTTHRPRGLPGLQHWGFPVIDMRREIAENTAYTQCFLLSDSEFSGFKGFGALGFRVLGFRVHRLVTTKTLALRRFLSTSKDNVWTPF